MVKVSLLKVEEERGYEYVRDDGCFSELDLLEITQQSSILDLFFDNECVSKISPYLVEVK